MPSEWSYVMNLGNSIIGVSVLAMPYCLRQCGLILGLLLLFVSAYLTRLSCNLLLKTAKQARRTSYEYLALHSFGSVGKLAVETSIIGLLLGTCIAFFVIIGDLGPAIVSKWFGFENTWSLRTTMLILVAIFIVLPLGLLKKVEQLSSISALSFSFYTILIAQIILISLPNLISFSWVNHARYWRVEGLFHCLSIFSLAFTCHTQVFVVYESLPDRTERKMNDIVKGAVNMVAFCYIMVGFFGYVAFIEQGIKGDVLMNFKASFVNDLLKFGFVVSVALSFPMMIMPCRAAIYTLISGSQGPSLENPLGGGEPISQTTHRVVTGLIVGFALMVGVAIPNVETILGLTGSTTGTMIGYIFPAIMFLRCLPKGPGVKSAQMVLFLGIIIMFASTYSTLQSRPDEIQIVQPGADLKLPDQDQLALDENQNVADGDIAINPDLDLAGGDIMKALDDNKDGGDGGVANDDKEEIMKGKEVEIVPDKRQEPPIPHAPADSPEMIEKQNVDEEKNEEVIDIIGKDAGDEQEVERGVDIGDDREDVVVKQVEDIQGIGDTGPDGHNDDDDEAHKRLEEKVDQKVKEQEQKHEEQQKMIEELKEKQDIQERVIEQQQEVIEELKKQHDESMENPQKPGEGQQGDDNVGVDPQQHVQPRAIIPDNQEQRHDAIPDNQVRAAIPDNQPVHVIDDRANDQRIEAVPQNHAIDPQREDVARQQDPPAPIVGNDAAKKMLEDAQQLAAELLADKKDIQLPNVDLDNQHLQPHVQGQEQQRHEIKLPSADLNKQAVHHGAHNVDVQDVPKQLHPRDILEVDGKIAAQDEDHDAKQSNHHGDEGGKDEIAGQHVDAGKREEAVDSKEHGKREENELMHGGNDNKGNHGNKNDDELERDRRAMPEEDDDVVDKELEDRERKLYEEHLENVMRVNKNSHEAIADAAVLNGDNKHMEHMVNINAGDNGIEHMANENAGGNRVEHIPNIKADDDRIEPVAIVDDDKRVEHVANVVGGEKPIEHFGNLDVAGKPIEHLGNLDVAGKPIEQLGNIDVAGKPIAPVANVNDEEKHIQHVVNINGADKNGIGDMKENHVVMDELEKKNEHLRKEEVRR